MDCIIVDVEFLFISTTTNWELELRCKLSKRKILNFK